MFKPGMPQKGGLHELRAEHQQADTSQVLEWETWFSSGA
jgi:hypothetical protein